METVNTYHLELLKGTSPGDHSEIWKQFVVSVPPAWLILILHLKIFSPTLRFELNTPHKEKVDTHS